MLIVQSLRKFFKVLSMPFFLQMFTISYFSPICKVQTLLPEIPKRAVCWRQPPAQRAYATMPCFAPSIVFCYSRDMTHMLEILSHWLILLSFQEELVIDTRWLLKLVASCCIVTQKQTKKGACNSLGSGVWSEPMRDGFEGHGRFEQSIRTSIGLEMPE